MNLNTPKPDSFNDGLLLRFIINCYELEHPREDGYKSIAQILGKSIPHIKNCVANTSCLGIDQWTRVVAQSGNIAQTQFKKYLASCERKANKQ